MASVRVAALLPTRPEVSKAFFKGDDERLLERMLEACQARPTARLPGYGRQLVPYFSEAAEGAGQPLEHRARAGKREGTSKPEGRRQNKKKSPRRGANNAGGGFSAGAGRDGALQGGQSPPVPINSGRGRPEERGAIRKKASVPAGQAAAKGAAGHCDVHEQRKAGVPDATFAGPGYFLSPPPEALPMPTPTLLSRAMAVSY
eukprot:evm.model.scf_227.8 EVM.evm.TU.scf_227.8   scf_227:109742-110953(-)